MGIFKSNKNKFKAPDGGCYSVRNITSIKDMINQSVELFGDKEGFLSKKEKGGKYFETTYKRFKEEMDALGTTLLEMGLAGEKIAIIGANSYQWVVSYFAIVNGVGVAVPLDKELKINEIENLVKTAECKAIFYSKEYEKVVSELDIEFKFPMNSYEVDEDKNIENTCREMIERGFGLIEEGNNDYINAEIDPDEMRVILFTSGTTGVAKGVMLSHKNIVSTVMSSSKIANFSKNDRALSILPIHHTFELSLTITTLLYQGASVAFYEGLKYILKNIQESKASVIIGVPLIVESLYNRIWMQARKQGKEKTLNTGISINKKAMAMGIDKRRVIFKSIYDNLGGEIKMLLSGAAALKPTTVRGFMDLGFDIMQGYGLTECAPLVAGTPMWDDIYGHAGSCGKVVPGGELRIENPDDEGIGEICYKGDNVMLGYYKMPEETAKVIKDGWFYTGDLGFIDKDGWLYITGRQKNVIVTKTGKNIYPEEIEELVNKIEYVSEAMVYGVDKEEGDTEVWTQIYPDYETIKEDMGIDIFDDSISEEEKENLQKKVFEFFDEKIKDCNSKLTVYKRIKTVVVREEDFIRTTTKKIKRKESMEL